MRNKWCVYMSLAGLLLGLPAAASAAAYESVSIANETIIASSDHFEIRTKPYTDDGKANNVSVSASAAQTALDTLEKVFCVYHDTLGLAEPVQIGTTKHIKTRVYVFAAGLLDALYGGQDAYGPGLWLGIGSLTDNWGLAHEYTHGLQSNADGIGNTAHAGWIYESHANWMAHQFAPSNVHCSEDLVNYPYLYYGSTRDRYCNWQYLEFLKDNHGVGDVNKIWTDSKRGNDQIYQTPLTAIMMVENWGLNDLNRDFGNWAMHSVTWDYKNGATYRSNYDGYDLSVRRGTNDWGQFVRNGRVTLLNVLDTSNGNRRYISPSYWAPQPFGYNLVRIYPTTTGADSKITVQFRGIVQEKNNAGAYTCYGNLTDYYDKQYSWCNLIPDDIGAPASNWEWGVVAIDASGNPRYSALQSGTAGDLDFDVKSSDKAIYMTVVAAPSTYQMILWDQFYYTIYRYPYMVGLVNAKAEGYQSSTWMLSGNTSGYSKHSNGGGYVSNSASVASTVYVGPNAVVKGGTLSGNAQVKDRAVVIGGTMSGSAVLEGDAILVSGSITENAKVGALSVIVNTNVSGSAKVYGVMRPIDGKTINGTGKLFGDLENNYSKTVSSGAFCGIIGDADLSNSQFGASLTDFPKEVTAPIEGAAWYDISSSGTENVPLVLRGSSLQAEKLAGAEWNVTLPSGALRLSVLDARGRILETRDVTGKTADLLSLKSAPAGMYVFLVHGAFGSRSVRVTR